MLEQLRILFWTLIYLKPRQVYYQIWYRIKAVFFSRLYKTIPYTTAESIQLQESIFSYKSYYGNSVFKFLNIEHNFSNHIDWNYAKYGKLWSYNLNYFDFLNQENINKEEGLKLIRYYVNNDLNLKYGKEPYPISLRGINWIKFLSKHKINDTSINQVLYNHYLILIRNIEYHLLANHLLENGLSLLFGAYYFEDEKLFKKGFKIVRQELEEQILKDGAHYECTPMYHKIILSRVLDVINLVNSNSWKQNQLIQLLEAKASKMLSWLSHITFHNGNVPMFNDSAYNIAPSSTQLFSYAQSLGVKFDTIPLKDSGYRKISKNKFELFVDVGNIQPRYQPGHSHADTFNFVLHYKENAIIVDTGISTYEGNQRRLLERSTSSHNTVTIDNENSSVVWGSFRIANRAKVKIKEDKDYRIEAHHDGFKRKFNVNHQRSFDFMTDVLKIKDYVGGKTAIARFHLHPDVKEVTLSKNEVLLLNNNIKFEFIGCKKTIQLKSYEYCYGFNKRRSASCVEVVFEEVLETEISILK